MLFIDSDNAMGSPSGDVDDAYAIAALVRGGAPIAAIASVAGNTSEPRAFENNQRLCRLLGCAAPLLRASEARAYLREFRGRVAALGPPTNCVDAKHASELVLVGGNSVSRGRFPPLWPHEFNLTKDREASRRVFALDVPLTIFPLNVARTLYATRADVEAIPGALGEYLRRETVRWFRHLRLVRWSSRFGIYDLAAALYLLDPSGFTIESTTARMHRNTWIEFGAGTRQVRVCTALDRDALWTRFVRLLASG